MRTGRIGLRVENKLQKKIKQFAEREDVTVAEFCRRLFESACEQYEAVLDLAMLRRLSKWTAEEYERVGHVEMLRRISSEKEKPVRKGKETR